MNSSELLRNHCKSYIQSVSESRWNLLKSNIHFNIIRDSNTAHFSINYLFYRTLMTFLAYRKQLQKNYNYLKCFFLKVDLGNTSHTCKSRSYNVSHMNMRYCYIYWLFQLLHCMYHYPLIRKEAQFYCSIYQNRIDSLFHHSYQAHCFKISNIQSRTIDCTSNYTQNIHSSRSNMRYLLINYDKSKDLYCKYSVSVVPY